MNEQGQSEQLQGRSITAYVYGADREGVEMAALDEARKFFGGETRLEIVPDYHVRRWADNTADQRYGGNITVREVTG